MICTVKLDFCRESTNRDAPRLCHLILASDQCLLSRLLRMREHFGLREAFHGYPLIEFLIMEREYRLSIVTFFIDLVSRQGRHILMQVIGASQASGCFFIFLANKTQNLKNRTACRPTFYFQLKVPFAKYTQASYNFTS